MLRRRVVVAHIVLSKRSCLLVIITAPPLLRHWRHRHVVGARTHDCPTNLPDGQSMQLFLQS